MFKNKNILIIGDVMLDSYLFGDVTRISPEAPVPIVNISNKKDKHIPLGCKCYCEYIYDFALNGDIQLNGSITGLANPNNSHYFTISLSIEIKYNDFGNYYIESKDIEGNNYDVFGDTILLYDDQKCATIIKGKGIKEWTDGDGEVWKLIE